ncbi:MAG: hypothetical protein WAT09_03765 [Paracoccaceae bacterium]
MRHLIKAAAALAVLTGCAAVPGNPRPHEVRLTDRALVLGLTDGSRCTADWAAAPVGRMPDCGPGYGYAVKVEDRPNVLRQLAEGLLLALGAQGVLRPMAEVVITDPAGVDYIFTSPQRTN